MASILSQPPESAPPATSTVMELAAVGCPIDRARRVTGIARANGTLPPQLAALRRAALIEASVGHSITELARTVGLTPGRICQLVGARRLAREVVA